MEFRECSTCGSIAPKDQPTCDCKRLRRNESKRQYRQTDYGQELASFFNSKRWKLLRSRVLNRDNYFCMRCLHKFGRYNSKQLQAHHIKSHRNHPELKWNIDNLIACCKTCNLELGTSDELDFEIKN